MFCIAAFIILSILGIFSGYYRNLAKKAWGCVAKKLTFKPCDISFQEEIKGKMLGKVILKRPHLARFLEKTIDFLAVIFVVATIWSLLVVVNSGLNLFVYDTCNPQNAESCSLGGEACSVGGGGITFGQSIMEGRVGEWVIQDVKQFGTTISLIPNRLKTWDPKEFVTADNTYLQPYNESKPTALEIIDPGCKFCAKLFDNIEQANFADKYNLTYIAYPIPLPDGGYKFQNSLVITKYLEAMKTILPAKPDPNMTADWQVLKRLFVERDPNNARWQDNFDYLYTDAEARKQLEAFALEFGYSQQQIPQLRVAVDSQQISEKISKNREVVEKQIRTIKIPTIMFDGRRFDRVIGVDKLK